MSIKISGLDKLQNRLDSLKKASENLEKTTSVSFDDLFTTSFMLKNTQFSSFNELLKVGNFIVNSQEDFEKIDDAEFDSHISKYTNFSKWSDMLSAAGKEYTLKKLNF